MARNNTTNCEMSHTQTSRARASNDCHLNQSILFSSLYILYFDKYITALHCARKSVSPKFAIPSFLLMVRGI
jgi:hypothetical protein